MAISTIRTLVLPWAIAFVLTVPSSLLHAQSNNSWKQQQQWQRQQDQIRLQQEQQRQQMQAEQRRQMQEQQRQQMQAQQRQQMQEQQRQQMQVQQQNQQRQIQQQQQQKQQQAQQQKQQQQHQQRQQAQTSEQQRRQLQQQGKLGVARPLTPGEIQRGFTGRVTSDGRALIRYQGRVVTVPASRVSGLSAKLASQKQQQAPRWTAEQKTAINNQIKALAAPNSNISQKPSGSNGGGGPGCRPPGSANCQFNAAATRPGPFERIQLKKLVFAYGLNYGTTKSVATQDANKPYLDAGYKPPYKEDRAIYAVSGRPSERLVRVYNDKNAKEGRWLVPEREIRGKSSRQIQDYLALTNEPTHISEWHPQKDSYEFYVGVAKEQPELADRPLAGGTIQLELKETPLPGDFSDGVPINEWSKNHR